MISFLVQLKSVVTTLEDHMLSDANLLTDPAHIYVDSFSRKIHFVPICQAVGSFRERLRPVAETMFLHADLEDADSLRFAASMLKTVMQGNIRMHDLMRLTENQRTGIADTGVFGIISDDRAARAPAPEAAEVPGKPDPCLQICEDAPGNGKDRGITREEKNTAVQLWADSGDKKKDLSPQKEKTGMKEFFSGLLMGLKEKIQEEE